MTITKDWLGKAISDIEAMRDEIPFGLDEDERNTLEALSIALASLEAEPYGYVHKAAYEQAGSCGLSNDQEAYRDSTSHIAVYTAPSAPVVQDYNCAWDATVKTAELEPTILPDEFIKRVVFDLVYTGLDEQTRNDEEMLHELVNSGMLIFHNQLAMLNLTKNSTPAKPLHENSVCVRYSDINESGQSKAEPPVIPDDWVACNEWMPEKHERDIWLFNGEGVYQGYVWDGYEFVDWNEGYESLPGVTHWMPMILPAAPQQESE